jgi:hypothetical protein
MLKNLLRRLPPSAYYNVLTTHDVIQAMTWRRLAPPVADATFRQRYQMLFVLGCGRSGTTIFSHCLGRHEAFAELNEPLHIWFGTDAKTDIVSPFAGIASGLCRLDRRHVDDRVRARYRAMVDYHVKSRSPIICDKLPLNTFRVDYIDTICPTAKFILLQRSPRAVARSIEQCVKKDGIWWGFNDCKWRAIRRYAESHPELQAILPHAVDDYYRGLVEWRVGQELALSDLSRLGPERSMTVRYEDFVADPRGVLERSFAFSGVPSDDRALDFAAANVAPKRAAADDPRQSAADDRRHAGILGRFLDLEAVPTPAPA